MAAPDHAGYAYGAPPLSDAPTSLDWGDAMEGDRDMEMAVAMDGLDIEEPVVASSNFAASSTGPVPMNPETGSGRKMLDLVFIQDATGSQGSYITHATENIEEICNTIVNTGKLARPDDLRLGLIAFRDHPPQDNTFITKKFPFTSDVAEMKSHLNTLYASGGGDGPEAVTAALFDALNMDWRPEARRMVVLIADAPPHGLGEYGDGFDGGSPDGHDPIQIVREMSQRGITLFFVACEPALSGYLYANEFYHAMTSLTGGTVLPLTTSSLLSHAIIGSVLENLDMEDLIREVGQHVADRVLKGGDDVDDIARQLHEALVLRKENTKKLKIESIYRTSEESAHNISVWQQAPDIKSARPMLKKVSGSRFTDKYQASKYSSTKGGIYHYSSAASSFSPYAPALPSRSGAGSSAESSIVTPPMTPIRAPAASPFGAGKIGEFAAFSAPKTTLPTSPFGASGGGMPRRSLDMRDGAGLGRGMDDDDDDDDDDRGGRTPGMSFEEDQISYDQVKRIVIASTFRGMRT